MKLTLAILAAVASVALAQNDGGLADLKAQYPQYFEGVTGLHVPAQYQGEVQAAENRADMLQGWRASH
ncbi:hypothetical protein CJU90_1690 [Yarrowia sp. C11]|nr:hypothetical protein CJU90_1690 [Yarrowia sp. C11]